LKHRIALAATLVALFVPAAFVRAQTVSGQDLSSTRPADGLIDAMGQPERWFTEETARAFVTMATCEGRDGQAASALSVKVGAEKLYGLAMRRVTPSHAWNEADGLCFWVKGDGSENWGNLHIQAADYRKAWVASFPLNDSQWHEVRVAWGDFVPTTAFWRELGDADGARPGDVDLVGFGKEWNFNLVHKSPEIAFGVQNLGLARGVKARRPRVAVSKLPPLESVVRKLKAGEPVTILALGDSITWGTSAGGNQNAYPAVLVALLKEHYHNDRITLVSRAIGGSTTAKGREWLMRDVQGLEADLITAMFGYNERPGAGADPAAATTQYTANLVRYVEEVAGILKAPPACVLLAPTPGRQANWEALDAYAQGVRDLGKQYANLTIADANAFMKQMGQEAYGKMMADEAHPNPEGQKVLAGVVFRAIIAEPRR